MKQTPPNGTAEQHVREIRRQTRKKYSAEEKIRIVISGLRGEHSIAALCRREGIAESLYYMWSKEFMGEVQAPLVRAQHRTARSVWPATPSARRRLARSKTCAGRWAR
jgi:transposase